MVRGAVLWQDPMQRYRLHDLLCRNILSCDLGSKALYWLVCPTPATSWFGMFSTGCCPAAPTQRISMVGVLGAETGECKSSGN